eukprot:23793-Chlamydomonas_euryale.AAC.1
MLAASDETVAGRVNADACELGAGTRPKRKRSDNALSLSSLTCSAVVLTCSAAGVPARSACKLQLLLAAEAHDFGLCISPTMTTVATAPAHQHTDPGEGRR